MQICYYSVRWQCAAMCFTRRLGTMFWSSARSTTAAHCWIVFPVIFCAGQSPFNAVVRDSHTQQGVLSGSRYSIHWLRVPQRIRFRPWVLVYRWVNGRLPGRPIELRASVVRPPSKITAIYGKYQKCWRRLVNIDEKCTATEIEKGCHSATVSRINPKFNNLILQGFTEIFWDFFA